MAFDTTIPKHWFAGRVFATQLANGVNLLFPAGERFFVRSVRRYLDRLGPELAADVAGFFGQEGRHAQAHERFFELLEAQGYQVERFLAIYELIAYGMIERVATPELRLAVTAACEHFTAIMAEGALQDPAIAEVHPAVRRLILWHAAEEIEHKAVAFEVLKHVAPGYRLRMAGLIVASLCLGGFWVLATAMLLAQERGYGPRAFARELRELRGQRQEGTLARVFVRGIREYVRRDFHPMHNDNYHLARDYFASAGIAP